MVNPSIITADWRIFWRTHADTWFEYATLVIITSVVIGTVKVGLLPLVLVSSICVVIDSVVVLEVEVMKLVLLIGNGGRVLTPSI